MAATDSFSVHVSGATDAADCGTINNTANVTTGNDGSGAASALVVVRCPDLEVVKSGNGPINAGDPATFTIILTNHGPGASYYTTLTDQLPSGTWTLGGANAADCSINGSNLLSCNFGTVASGASRTITVTTTTTAADCGTIHNEVSVSASNENTANDQFPNSDDADIDVNCPDLEVVKSGNGPLSAGQVATFSITVTNHGPGTAYDVSLTDQLPSGTWTLGGANAADCAINGSNLLSCDFGDLANGASRTITVSKTTDADDCGTLHNDVTVAASNEDTATDQFPNSASPTSSSTARISRSSRPATARSAPVTSHRSTSPSRIWGRRRVRRHPHRPAPGGCMDAEWRQRGRLRDQRDQPAELRLRRSCQRRVPDDHR